MKKLNIYSSLAKLGLVSTVLLTGCSQTTELKPTPPTTGNDENSNLNIDEKYEIKDNYISIDDDKYIILDRGEEEYIDENGNFIHNHDLDFENFVFDYKIINRTSPGKACENLQESPDQYELYLNTGRITNTNIRNEIVWNGSKSIDSGYLFLESMEAICGDTIDDLVKKHGK